MFVIRFPLAVLLSLTLVVTSVSAGIARGQATPVGTVELCRGLTTVSVQVDADGVPVTHVHLCPDGVMTLVSDLSDGHVLLVPLAVWARDRPVSVVTVRSGRDVPRATARGPPLSV